ncbi:sugar phosphate isomerase/epimerase [Alkalihalobacillus sp. LMS39]|uniref:sugar phosphate isomerase/epimerase family protein n=1 Tax=Alkalihalobacillus sp. LMS39 TaxID=2924032 RepID=UPI001FB23090|nr:sugar phosphate isomerase/epimerase [Alkalihalobacillus sp. LMS39]UOE93056.1 sugar phosphate isomerase/epimerase [Alkalihalobacillus sp. LMS39]
MTVGVLAHLFGKKPYQQLAKEIGSCGFEHVQLALWKACSDYPFEKPGYLNPGLVRKIVKEFEKNGVAISILACYVHLFERDEVKRRENIVRFKEALQYAPKFGAAVVAVEVGKMAEQDRTEEDWLTLKATLIELEKEAEKWGVIIGIEPADGHLIDNAKTLKHVLDELNSSSFGVIIDPGNLLISVNFSRQDDVIREAFELLGPRIIAGHLKDRKLTDEGILKTVTPGQGDMNLALYMKLLEKYKPNCDVILEHTNREQMIETKHYIEAIRQSV